MKDAGGAQCVRAASRDGRYTLRLFDHRRDEFIHVVIDELVPVIVTIVLVEWEFLGAISTPDGPHSFAASLASGVGGETGDGPPAGGWRGGRTRRDGEVF